MQSRTWQTNIMFLAFSFAAAGYSNTDSAELPDPSLVRTEIAGEKNLSRNPAADRDTA